MTATALLIAAALLGHARAGVVELSCSDNATCFENLANEFVRSVRQQKTVRLFDTLTVEPLGTRQARSDEGLLAGILNHNAFSYDWNDYTFRIAKSQDLNDALDLEVFESRTAKDVSEEVPKKSKSKVEEEEEPEDHKKSPKSPKAPKGAIRRRRTKKKILQAVIPMIFGMKSSAVFIFAMAVVTALTMKAFLASKLALMVTVGMAVKRLYESYSMGGLGFYPNVGLQNHPYLYSQYPIDFPSASSHAYSVSGMSPQFPEMYNPTAMGTHQQSELQQQHDASAQQSQQAPTVQLLNSTRASERWDGKSTLQKLLEPLFEGIKSYIDPIANVFYSMPATFRGLNSDVTTMKTVEDDVKKPREILIPQPRNIAQRKMNYRKAAFRSRPKKYTELKVDLNKLKKNKDLYDYLKTKKYKHNYQHTYYYPRIKYFVNPNSFIVKPKNTRLVPYKMNINNTFVVRKVNTTGTPINVWKPIILVPVLSLNSSKINITKDFVNKPKKVEETNLKRSKRSIFFYSVLQPIKNKSDLNTDKKEDSENYFKLSVSGKGFIDFVQMIIDEDPVSGMMNYASKYTKSAIKNSLKSHGPPFYYKATYELLMMTLDVIDGLVQVHEALSDYWLDDSIIKKTTHALTHNHAHGNKNKKKKQKNKKKKPNKGHHGQQQSETQDVGGFADLGDLEDLAKNQHHQ